MVSSGNYAVKEDGLQFQHDETNKPCSPEEYLLRFRADFEMNILEQPDKHTLVFEIKNCDTSFANALRRILLAEVPTVALEHVYMWNNSSLIHDEVLAHRIGLIPLNLDARLLDDCEVDEGEEFTPTDRNTVVFRLAVSCPHKAPKEEDSKDDSTTTGNAAAGDNDDLVVPNAELQEAAQEAPAPKLKFPKDRPYTKHVYSSDFVWVPQGDQKETLGEVKPIHDDILIAKLRPGQAIELEAHGRRGIGKDHAKYSPSATASYRLMPKIELLEPVYDELAHELVHVYEPGVFKLVPVDHGSDEDVLAPPGSQTKAVVCNPYACTMSRNFMRHAELSKCIRMSRVAGHFIFSVESVGAYTPGVLVAEALRVLQQKCRNVMEFVDESTMKTES